MHFKEEWIKKSKSLKVKFRNCNVLDKYHNVLIINGSLCTQPVSQKLLHNRSMHLLFLLSFLVSLIFFILCFSFFSSNSFYPNLEYSPLLVSSASSYMSSIFLCSTVSLFEFQLHNCKLLPRANSWQNTI